MFDETENSIKSYNFRDDIYYADMLPRDMNQDVDIYKAITENVHYSSRNPLYVLEAYTTCRDHSIRLQYPHGVLLPIVHAGAIKLPLSKLMKKDINHDYVVIFEKFTILNSADAENLAYYYSSGPLTNVVSSSVCWEMSCEIKKAINKNRLPFEITVVHTIDLDKVDGARSIYLPSLNLQMYVGDVSERDKHIFRQHVGEPVAALNKNLDKGRYSVSFKIVNNLYPDKKYYTKILGNTVEINSVSSLSEEGGLKVEHRRGNIKSRFYIDKNLGKKNLMENGIFESKSECENSGSLENILENKKLELEFDKVNYNLNKIKLDEIMNRGDTILKAKNLDVGLRKAELDLKKTELDYIAYNRKLFDNITCKGQPSNKIDFEKEKSASLKINNFKNLLELTNSGIKTVQIISALLLA